MIEDAHDHGRLDDESNQLHRAIAVSNASGTRSEQMTASGRELTSLGVNAPHTDGRIRP